MSCGGGLQGKAEEGKSLQVTVKLPDYSETNHGEIVKRNLMREGVGK